MNNIESNHKTVELEAAILSLATIKRSIPKDIFCQIVELHLPKLVQWTNTFINSPDTSYFKLSYICKIMGLLSDINPIDIADKYYNAIDIIKLVRLLQYESVSFVSNFLQNLIKYLSRSDHQNAEIAKNNVSAIFIEIKLSSYSNELNDKLRFKWYQVSRPNYIFKDKDALTTTIARASEPFIKAAALIDDEIIKQAIMSDVAAFYSAIEWKMVGKLIEAYKIGFGPVCKLIEMLRKSKCNKIVLNEMLSELDFLRIANDYNNKPINNAHLTFFCKVYLSKQTASLQWRTFFETIDFKFIREKGGFNFADTSFMLQLLSQIYRDDHAKLSQLLESLDFSATGIKSRGKDEVKLNNLFERLLKAKLTASQYAKFLEGFGSEDCSKIPNNKYLKKIIQLSGMYLKIDAEHQHRVRS
ncbi:MAG: hypothetical protein WC156_11815 [Pedobacter sp.]